MHFNRTYDWSNLSVLWMFFRVIFAAGICYGNVCGNWCVCSLHRLHPSISNTYWNLRSSLMVAVLYFESVVSNLRPVALYYIEINLRIIRIMILFKQNERIITFNIKIFKMNMNFSAMIIITIYIKKTNPFRFALKSDLVCLFFVSNQTIRFSLRHWKRAETRLSEQHITVISHLRSSGILLSNLRGRRRTKKLQMARDLSVPLDRERKNGVNHRYYNNNT